MNFKLALAGLAGTLMLSTAAVAQDVTLTVQHFLGPNATVQKVLIEPWAQRIEEQSDGRIQVEIFPAMSMGGKAPELYRQVRDGLADIVWTLPSYTPGQFKRLEVFELPGVHRNSARATTMAIQSMMPMLAADLEEVHPLLIHVHGGYALHLKGHEVTEVADLQGVKLRTPSRVAGWLIGEWGAEPVSMPAPDLPQALSKGAIEGALLPFEAAGPMKLDELTDFTFEGPDHLRSGTTVFLFAMNKERYDSLPDDLKAVIDANSGAAIAEEIGAGFDQVERDVAAQFAQSRPVIEMSPEGWAGFETASDAVIERWSADVSQEGIDAPALIDAAHAAIARFSE
ncbi:TRAP transporter substrate-binding protein [Pseudooceanicola sp. 200-1SW]|uniref:TRAP transporter substrate-binding protein n=1 Tax=Pseudooceanicola sp. 200-1SW TaxID=3425949 RepID=UPI003D7FEEC6